MVGPAPDEDPELDAAPDEDEEEDPEPDAAPDEDEEEDPEPDAVPDEEEDPEPDAAPDEEEDPELDGVPEPKPGPCGVPELPEEPRPASGLTAPELALGGKVSFAGVPAPWPEPSPGAASPTTPVQPTATDAANRARPTNDVRRLNPDHASREMGIRLILLLFFPRARKRPQAQLVTGPRVCQRGDRS